MRFFKYLLLIFTMTLLFSCQAEYKKKTGDKILKLNFQEGDPPSLHPHRNISHIRCVSLNKLLFESLTRIDESQKAVLAGASSVDISEDKLNYTFTLRDCKYSNGKKVTAYDYEAAWRAAISPDSLCIRPDLFYVIKNARAIRESKKNSEEFGVKALDEKTLKVQLKYPCIDFLELIASSIFAPIKNNHTEPKFFNGPFLIDKWAVGENIILKKNNKYWDVENINLDVIKIDFIKDLTTNFLQFQEQKIDWIGSPISVVSLEELQQLEKNNNLKQRVSNFIFWIHINTELPHFQSKDIRKALSLAIDRKEINDHILIGYEPVSFLPTSLAPIKQVFEYNPEQAKECFLKGLQKLNILEKKFPEITLSFFTYPKMKMLAQYLKQAWEKTLNIKVNILEQDWNYFRSSQENKEFDIGGCYESVLFPGPMDLLQRIEKVNGWNNLDFTKTLRLIRYARNEKDKRFFLVKALDILKEEVPVIVLSNEKETFAKNPLLKGYVFDYTNGIDFSRSFFIKK
jgi:oligopeptide transport system substrate-binding protein